MILQPQGIGWMEVICGPMFSGKTEELIRRLRRALIAGLSVQTFKPAIDDRYAALDIASHDGRTLEALAVRDVDEIRSRLREDVRVVGIDEVQFFSEDVVALCIELADRGVRVIVAGLDQDYHACPFEPVPRLLAEAEFITKSLSICSQCGNPAHRSHRIVLPTEGGRASEGAGEGPAGSGAGGNAVGAGEGPAGSGAGGNAVGAGEGPAGSGAGGNAVGAGDADVTNPVDVGAVGAYVPLCRRCYAQERDLVSARASQGRLSLRDESVRGSMSEES